jgi:tetratricopeptide (TPR) repeat protein
MTAEMEPWREVARVAASALSQGTLKLRDVVGLTDAEMQAVAQTAAALHRSGRHAEARAALALLLLYDPMNAVVWRQMADLHQSLGDHAVAVACYEAAALLGGREAGASRREARSLEQLGQPRLATQIVELRQLEAGELAAEESAP